MCVVPFGRRVFRESLLTSKIAERPVLEISGSPWRVAGTFAFFS